MSQSSTLHRHGTKSPEDTEEHTQPRAGNARTPSARSHKRHTLQGHTLEDEDGNYSPSINFLSLQPGGNYSLIQVKDCDEKSVIKIDSHTEHRAPLWQVVARPMVWLQNAVFYQNNTIYHKYTSERMMLASVSILNCMNTTKSLSPTHHVPTKMIISVSCAAACDASVTFLIVTFSFELRLQSRCLQL